MFGNKYYSNQANNENARPAVKPTADRRRPLGDITNNHPEEGPRDGVAKRVLLQQAPIPAPAPMHIHSHDDNTVMSDRSYMQRACDDIDSRDQDNPLLVTYFADEMYKNFNNLERDFKVSPSYMTNVQEVINEKMRAILVDWLVEVHLKFKMVPETMYITVQVIDRFLQLKPVRRSRLQLVGVAALLLAAKYEEIYAPDLRELVFITDKAYTREEIVDMETEILLTLDFQMTVPTIHTFLCRYLKAAHADRTMVQLSCYLTERSLQEYSMLKYLPSQIAATAVMVARKSLNRHPWSPTLLKYTNYDECDLANCAEDMNLAIGNKANQQVAVHRKYSSAKFGSVARMPLSF